ncbi:SDR family oxidoreductase [Nodularia spumigena]|uniref:SDR family oxidoreductase n=1 Tax=Nodularia spumigena TaxID=70799 RepID=UPI00232F3313|nr:SDR family oxidoreductase [Nodularia spumigena]MDB9340373.1 SDR family oxidoreductase [Nodularia spumigena CS-589/07]MDB9345097.1 SDR family oxidoreductase [Nodularia spumigena CS-588/06]MDB9369376.1 SDR family oxidoreductase [Nodularia spumigena CS-586/05]MDB9497143.1 SDR family oxidoreductase [Nodularia spumigena CS-336/02]MDB9533589.1 SDR family oxidoreductase [Nodularia spumigena CS-1038]
MTSASYIFIAGASRGVGREIAKYLTAQNLQVKALLRNESAVAELESMGIEIVMGDALDISDVQRAIIADQPIHTVISTIGGLPSEGERADFLGNKNIIDAAVKAGVHRFILVSSIGTGNSAGALPPQALATLGPVLVEKDKAEQHLIASGLIYTIIRPGGLKSEPATGNGILTEDPRIVGTIHRPDVAELVCKSLNSQLSHYKTLSAVDKNMLAGEPEFVEFTLEDV